MATIDIEAIRAAVTNAKAQIPGLQAEIVKATAAGIDTADFKDRLNKLQQQVTQLETYYLK